MQALLGGSADVVAGYYEHTIRVAPQGRAVKSLVLMTRYPGDVLVVSPLARQRISHISDIRGALVGVPDQGSQAHLFVNYLLGRNGLAPSDITVVSVGNLSGGVAALEHGKIDVWCGFDPGVTQYLRRHADAKIIVDARDRKGVREAYGTDIYAGTVLYSTAAWIEQHPSAARKAAQAVLQALRWIHQHSPAQIASKVPIAQRGADDDLYIETLRKAMPTFSEDGVLPKQAANAALSTLRVSLESVRSAKIDVSKTYTNEFVVPR